MLKDKTMTPNEEMRAKYVPCQSAGKDDSCADYFKLLKSKGLWVN